MGLAQKKSAGILLPLSSLPGEYGIGGLGKTADEWVDRLCESQQSLWQVLPLSYFDQWGCPYASYSAFGAHPLYLDLEDFHRQGLLEKNELDAARIPSEAQINWPLLREKKFRALKRSSQSFWSSKGEIPEMFLKSQAYWIGPLSEYLAKKNEGSESIKDHLFWQWSFHQQWIQLKSKANQKGLKIFGDLPLFVGIESMDVTCFPQFFKLGPERKPTVLSGAPPDDYAEEGQIWGTPQYDWDALENANFSWWLNRFKYNQELFDYLRIDHFIGMENVWEVPVSSKGEPLSAKEGKWVKTKGRKLLELIQRELPDLTLIAEDLGQVSDDVHQLRDDFSLPGMRVIQFGLDKKTKGLHHPSNVGENTFYYTGTHDNPTLAQWLQEKEKEDLETTDIDEITKLVLNSKANTAIIPLQDWMKLGAECRINTPGTLDLKNWSWRLKMNDWKKIPWDHIKEQTLGSGRGLKK